MATFPAETTAPESDSTTETETEPVEDETSADPDPSSGNSTDEGRSMLDRLLSVAERLSNALAPFTEILTVAVHMTTLFTVYRKL